MLPPPLGCHPSALLTELRPLVVWRAIEASIARGENRIKSTMCPRASRCCVLLWTRRELHSDLRRARAAFSCCHYGPVDRGEWIRTTGLLLPKQALWTKLSYTPLRRISEGSHLTPFRAPPAFETGPTTTVSSRSRDPGRRTRTFLSALMRRASSLRCRVERTPLDPKSPRLTDQSRELDDSILTLRVTRAIGNEHGDLRSPR